MPKSPAKSGDSPNRNACLRLLDVISGSKYIIPASPTQQNFYFVAFADFPDSLPLGPGFQAKTLISLCGFSPFFCCVGDFAGRVHLGSVTFFSCLPIGQSVRGMQAAPPPWPGDGPQAQRCRCVVGMAPPTVGSFL